MTGEKEKIETESKRKRMCVCVYVCTYMFVYTKFTIFANFVIVIASVEREKKGGRER